MFNKIFFICLVLAISKSNCIELENICDTFKHNGSNGDFLTVNSVHKMKFDLPTKKISNFLIDEDISFENVFPNNPKVAQKMNQIRTTNNKIVKEVYNENFLNSPENVKKIYKYRFSKTVFDNLRTAQSFKVYADSDKSYELDNAINKLKNVGSFFFRFLFLQFNNRFYSIDNESLELFKNLISDLKKSIESDEKFVLENETSDYILKNVKIFTFTKFKHNSNRPTNTLFLHVYLPFYNPKYVKSDNCLSVKNLPKFYHMN